MSPKDINTAIDQIIISGKMKNRLPQNLELAPGVRNRLVDFILNLEDANNTEEYIAGALTGFILGYGHLFNDVYTMFRNGMIERKR